jgi:HAMP domain-containing protein
MVRMNSFRNRLLALIIGLVVTMQSVTLVAVLANTDHEVKVRADERLRSGSQVVQEFMRYRAEQLSSTVAVLARDSGFREAVASRDADTMLSAATNHAERIGADLVMLMDTDGRPVTANSGYVSMHAAAVQKMVVAAVNAREDAHLVVMGDHLYQFFVAPVRAPETIGWVAMGFAVDDELASKVRDLVPDHEQVSVLAGDGAQLNLVASTLPPAPRAALAARRDLAAGRQGAQPLTLASQDYLTYVAHLGDAGEAAAIVLQEPMAAVMAPYRSQRNALLAIGGLALGGALAVSLLLSRSASRPIRELVRAARRIQAGTYDKAVDVGGGDEFRSLAATFNVMQDNIAEREARIMTRSPDCPTASMPSARWRSCCG